MLKESNRSMRYHMDVSEWYPVLTLCKEGDGLGDVREFTDVEIDDLRRVLLEFRAWQSEIRKRFGESIIRPYDMMGGAVESIDLEAKTKP